MHVIRRRAPRVALSASHVYLFTDRCSASSLLLNIFDANVESEPERRQDSGDSAVGTGFYPTVNVVRSRDHSHPKFKAAMVWIRLYRFIIINMSVTSTLTKAYRVSPSTLRPIALRVTSTPNGQPCNRQTNAAVSRPFASISADRKGKPCAKRTVPVSRWFTYLELSDADCMT
jgi:hypothetical protein